MERTQTGRGSGLVVLGLLAIVQAWRSTAPDVRPEDVGVAVALEIAERELADLGSNTVLGSLRTLERLGSIIGLIVIAFLSSYIGYLNAVAVIAGLVFAGAGGFALVTLLHYLNSRSRQTEGSSPVDTS